jgi:hypothetical protein
VDQAAEELLGRSIEKDSLPLTKDDRPIMLAAGPVLGEDVGPVRVGRSDIHASSTWIPPLMNAQSLDEALQSGDTLLDDAGVFAPERDADVRVAALWRSEAAIT